MFSFKPRGVCAIQILFDIETDTHKIKNVQFVGGCPGNSQGVASLLRGMTVEEAIPRLKGINCRGGTSCPDQLSIALTQWLEQNK